MQMVCGKTLQSSLFLLVALLCVPAVGQAANRASYSSSSEGQVLVLLNDIRHEHGLGALAGEHGACAAPPARIPPTC